MNKKSRKKLKQEYGEIEEKKNDELEEFIYLLLEYFEATQNVMEDKLAAFYTKYGDKGILTKEELDKNLTKKEKDRLEKEYQEKKKEAGLNNSYFDQDTDIRTLNSFKKDLTRLDLILTQINTEVHLLLDKVSVEVRGLLENLYKLVWDKSAWGIYENFGEFPKDGGLSEENQNTAVDKVWRPDNITWEENLWRDKRWAAFNAESLIRQGLENGMSYIEIAEELQKLLHGSLNSCKRTVRTEATRMATQAAIDAFENTGVKKCVFTAVLDERTTPGCRAMDGTILNVEDIEPWVNAPPLHYNCRSYLVPVLDDGLPDYLNADREQLRDDIKTFDEWLDSTY